MLKSQAGAGGAAPKTLLIAPPALGKLSGLMALFYAGAEDAPRSFLDASKVAAASVADGVHLDPEDQRKLGVEVARLIARELESG